jgi:N-acetylneuraminic acid mutarotase
MKELDTPVVMVKANVLALPCHQSYFCLAWCYFHHVIIVIYVNHVSFVKHDHFIAQFVSVEHANIMKFQSQRSFVLSLFSLFETGFDFSSMTWREIQSRSGRPPSERHSHSAVVWGNSMFIFGGYDGSYKSDLHEFDFSLSKWSIVPAAGRRPRARYRATAVVHKHLMIVHGGHDGTRHLNDTHVFDFDAHSWSALLTEGTPPIPRDSHVSVCWNGAVFIFGGSSGSAMNDLHELQLPSNPNAAARWRQVKSSSTDQPGHRFCHVAAVHQDQLYVFGGYDGTFRCLQIV